MEEEVEDETGGRGLRAPTMEGAAEETPAPGCFPLSGPLSALPPPCPAPQLPPLPGTSEAHGPKMAVPQLPPPPPAAGSDGAAAPGAPPITVALAAARLLLLGATDPVLPEGRA